MSNIDPLVARLWFESVDIDSSGLLDAKELRQALDIGGFNYSLSQAHLLVRAFDSKGNHKLDVNEFMELHRFLDAVQNCFARSARGGKSLSSTDAPQALAQMGFSLDAAAMQAVLKRYDVEGKGAFSVDTFLRMCLFLHTSVRAFQGFDSSKSGRAEFSFNQFCYAASHLA